MRRHEFCQFHVLHGGPGWTVTAGGGIVEGVRGFKMIFLCPRSTLGLLRLLGAVSLLQVISARAALPGDLATAYGRHVHSDDPQLIITQLETSPVLPSLVLPLDATAGPPMFASFMQKGDSAMLHGNIIQARLFYERAAAINPASSTPLLAVGKTYDVSILSALGVNIGSFADPATARKWYQRARALGDPAAAEFIVRLP